MKPFLRPTDRARLAPVGWVAKRAGIWAGREVEIVFDPKQHQVVIVRNDPGDVIRTLLSDAGFRRLAADGKQEMWLRDRTAALETAPRRMPEILSRWTRTIAGFEGRHV